MEYRVSPGGSGWWWLAGTFQDSIKAAAFLETLAKTYPIDLERIVLVGHSAGGHLALWLAAQHKLSEGVISGVPQSLPSFKSVVSLAGVSDLQMMHDIHQWKETLYGIVDNPTRDLLGGTPEAYKDRYEFSSPHALLPIGVPITLIHGSLDVNVPIGISERFQEVTTKAGDTVVFKRVSTAEHFQLILPSGEAWLLLLEAIKKFI